MKCLHAVFILASVSLIHSKVRRLTCTQIRKFVDGHNLKRFLLTRGEVPGQPIATDMKEMVWDRELAQKASRWASHNILMHNPVDTIPSNRFLTGENLFLFRTTDMDFELDVDIAMEEWFDEYQNFTFKVLEKDDFLQPVDIGHYSQMVWANSTYVGCAISEHITDWKNILVVCNYGPAGNYVGEQPYATDGRPSKRLRCIVPECVNIYGLKCKKKNELIYEAENIHQFEDVK